ncbi:MAG: pantetheine-phosphate adenylyltransferase [Candidatus Altiarchaeota archaeon]
MFKKIVVGGTFEFLHKGHRRLLELGAKNSEMLIVGLTSDEFASRFRAEKVSPYIERKRKLENFLKKFSVKYKIVKIDDNYGIATIDPEIDCIIVSEETLLRAEEINAIRFKKGLEKLVIIVMPTILAEDGKPLSSERIRLGEIDEYGRIKK